MTPTQSVRPRSTAGTAADARHEGWEKPNRRRPVAAWLLLAVVAAGVAVALRDSDSRPLPVDADTPTESATQAPPQPPGRIAGHWRPLPRPDLPGRAEASATWTGSHVVVWGGVGARPRSDGALYDPSTDTWTPVSPAGLSPRMGHAAVWTGREVVVAGGVPHPPPAVVRDGTTALRDAAAYDPAAGTWRELPTLPVAVVAGGLVADGADLYAVSATPASRPAAVLPAGADRWRLLPALPDQAAPGLVAAAIASGGLLVWPAQGQSPAAWFDPRAGSWDTVVAVSPRRTLPPQGCCAVVGGMTRTRHAQVVGYDAATGSYWRVYESAGATALTVTSSDAVFVVEPAAITAVDTVTGAVSTVPATPSGPRPRRTAAWTGVLLMVWGGVDQVGGRFEVEGAAFVPAGVPGPGRLTNMR